MRGQYNLCPTTRAAFAAIAILTAFGCTACTSETDRAPSKPLPNGLLLALAEFDVKPDGRAGSKPQPAKLLMLLNRGNSWVSRTLVDPQSNVFHKAMVYEPPGAEPGILTLGGNEAAIKLWRQDAQGFTAETLWHTTFGGKHNRMRDAEVGDLTGEGSRDLAVATHDQGVVATVHWQPDGIEITELDRRAGTFVHEIEIGDLDGDGINEIYATPSEPNRLDGTPQSGSVVRYMLKPREGPTTVIDLGTRHAKEILVSDIDGDGQQELYVAVEAESGGKKDSLRIKNPVEIRRYDMREGKLSGTVLATLDDMLCRFLTAGDIDGDGKRELVAAPWRNGLWLLRPGEDPTQPWSMTSIDRDSSGFEHAALLTDLDEDGTDELYVASDKHGEVRRYLFRNGEFQRDLIHKHAVPGSIMTWNIMPFPATMMPE